MDTRFDLLGLEYNLNIFNDGKNKAEVLARPSLVATENQTSEFFSGGELHVQLSSQNSDGSMVDIPSASAWLSRLNFWVPTQSNS